MLDPKGALPRYLRNPDLGYWSEEVPELDAVYVQLNRLRDDENEPTLAAFLESVVDGVRTKQTKNAIIDLRFSPGGDYTQSAAFTKSLPEALPPNGRLFVLTSSNTFSAAIVTAARLKYFGGNQAIIVGEPMGDREQFWGEGRDIVLPNSGLSIGYATAAHNWERRCGLDEIRTCFYVNYVLGVSAGKLAPDLPISPLFADYSSGQDTLLNTVASELAKQR